MILLDWKWKRKIFMSHKKDEVRIWVKIVRTMTLAMYFKMYCGM